MENKPLNSISYIEEMINKTKERYSDSGFLYLLWGYLVVFAALLNYVLLNTNSAYPFIGWAIFMPLGGLISFIYSIRNNKKTYVKTYTDDVMKYTWMAFGFLLAIILVFMGRLELNTYPLVMVAYGVPTFISGGVLKFKPLVIGALASVVIGIVSFNFTFDVQLLLLCASILAAYIIPGHLLRIQYLKTKN
jgi:hypothetical protein